MKLSLLIALLLMAGCAAPSDHKSPEELLSLSVAGLSGIDHYTFSGSTGIAMADGGMPEPMSFQGVVVDHHRIRMNAGGGRGAGTKVSMAAQHPLKLLENIQAQAGTVALMASESGNRTAVLQVELDQAAACRHWADRLRNEFNAVVNAGNSNVRKISARSSDNNASAALEREWSKEVDRSRRKLDGMLRTLKVQSTYIVIIDRVKMLPIRLQEQTMLQYESAGEPFQESRKSDIKLRMLPEGKRKSRA